MNVGFRHGPFNQSMITTGNKRPPIARCEAAKDKNQRDFWDGERGGSEG